MTIDVWMLTRYDGKMLYALAFSTFDELIEYVIDYYGDSDNPPTPPANDGDASAWLDAIASDWGIELTIDHDIMEKKE